MQQSDVECKTTKILATARVHCSECNRDFSIYKVIHQCALYAPCRQKKLTYEEVYFDSVASAVNSVCDECEEKKRSHAKLEFKTCPSCKFEGYYLSDQSLLCPVCCVVKPTTSHTKKPSEVKAKPTRGKPAHIYVSLSGGYVIFDNQISLKDGEINFLINQNDNISKRSFSALYVDVNLEIKQFLSSLGNIDIIWHHRSSEDEFIFNKCIKLDTIGN